MAEITRGGAAVAGFFEYSGPATIPEAVTTGVTIEAALSSTNLKVTGRMNFPLRKGDMVWFNDEAKRIVGIYFAPHNIIIIESAFSIAVPAGTSLELVRSGTLIEVSITNMGAGTYVLNGETIDNDNIITHRHEEGLEPYIVDATGTTIEVATLA